MAKDKSRNMLFAAYYVGEANFNATDAAALAGVEAKNRHSLQVIASQMMSKPDVQEYIRQHVEKAQITQDELLSEMADLARYDWKDNIEGAQFSMERAKVFDTMMRGKIKALSDLMKLYNSDLAKELEKVRKAIEQHRQEFPDLSDAERSALFKAHIEPKMVEQVMAELLKADENKKRLLEVEAETEDPMAATGE